MYTIHRLVPLSPGDLKKVGCPDGLHSPDWPG